MATPTYTLIDSTTLGSSAASVTFSSISATGKGDLVVVVNSLADAGTINFTMRFNGATTGYTAVTAYGDGGSAASFTSSSNLDLMAYGGNTTVPALVSATVLDFSSTNKHKTVLANGYRADKQASMSVGRWADTAAVTSLTIRTTTANNYAAGSTFFLYQLVSE
tara:strand:+ start:960 stop:1451 length:492 start_codon:yes stop_codon:yes gene_type:complete